MENKSKLIQEKVLSLIPARHEPVTVKVDLIYLDKNPYYKIDLYSRAHTIEFLPKWVIIYPSWEFNHFKFDNCFLNPTEAERLLLTSRFSLNER